jgi:uncharacterized membrane protein
MVEIIQKYQIKRIAILIFMMGLTWHVYDFTMEMMEIGKIQEWGAAALLGPISAMFPAVLAFLKED